MLGEGIHWTSLWLAWSLYMLGTASPGPSNLAVMATAMESGRKPALVLASGILAGSLIWGVLAAAGLSAVVVANAGMLLAMKLGAAAYLLWLSAKSLWAACAIGAEEARASSRQERDCRWRDEFTRGLLMHLTNPKAVFVWMSIVSVAMPGDAVLAQAFALMVGCGIAGTCVFGGYAVLLSNPRARSAHAALRPWLQAILAAFFGAAGFRMLAALRQ